MFCGGIVYGSLKVAFHIDFFLLPPVDKSSPSKLDSVWQQALESVGSEADPEARELLAALRPSGYSQDGIVVEAPTSQAAVFVREHYGDAIEKALSSASDGTLCAFSLMVPKSAQRELFPTPREKPPVPSLPERPSRETQRRAALIPKYTFANFIVGASNQFAHAASRAVAAQPGEAYNPLFIYGGVGLGKTHLINAIGHEALDRNPAARVVYLSSDSFMNELIASLRRDRMAEFKQRFRRVDFLILDDVQFLAGRERTQEEFFHTFNSLYEAHRQIILTSDRFPKEISNLEERLRNRFESGLIADIQPPDIETRVAILEKKAEIDSIELPQDVALFLATNIDSNIRELEGSLTRLGALSSFNKVPISIDFARDVLRNLLENRTSLNVTIESIQQTVSDYFRIRSAEMRGKKRSRNIALPRQIAMYLCRRNTDASFPVIGERFGGRDHSTVIHAAQVIERRIEEDPQLRETVDRLQRKIDGM